MEQLIPALLFLIGIALIVKGGDIFVDSSSSIARASGIPTFIIGATIVSFATTLPEIIVSIIAASEGKTEMAIGNAIGSVSANTGLILALGVICLPIVIKRRLLAFKGLLLIAVITTLLLLCLGGELTVLRSLPLAALFAAFIWQNVHEARMTSEPQENRIRFTRKQWLMNAVGFVMGALGIVVGSRLLVDNGSLLAHMLGVPENVIALTAVAIGTSLPELVTAVAAIRKRQGGLSIGNVLGANIIDMALILPACAAVTGGSLQIPPQALTLDLPVCLALAVILILPAIIREKFSRWQGLLAMLIYIGYLVRVII